MAQVLAFACFADSDTSFVYPMYGPWNQAWCTRMLHFGNLLVNQYLELHAWIFWYFVQFDCGFWCPGERLLEMVKQKDFFSESKRHFVCFMTPTGIIEISDQFVLHVCKKWIKEDLSLLIIVHELTWHQCHEKTNKSKKLVKGRRNLPHPQLTALSH